LRDDRGRLDAGYNFGLDESFAWYMLREPALGLTSRFLRS